MRIRLVLFLCLFLSSCASTSEDHAIVEQGYVILQFDINEQGATENIEVIESTHNGLFDREAVSSLKKWRYKPKLVNGQPARDTGKKVRLEFQIADH